MPNAFPGLHFEEFAREAAELPIVHPLGGRLAMLSLRGVVIVVHVALFLQLAIASSVLPHGEFLDALACHAPLSPHPMPFILEAFVKRKSYLKPKFQFHFN